MLVEIDESLEFIPRKQYINYIKRKYNVTELEYIQLLKKQNGGCKICGSKKKLVIDHDHRSGLIRGIICDCCNKSLGFAKDSTETLNKLSEYINNSKTCNPVAKNNIFTYWINGVEINQESKVKDKLVLQKQY